jgi:hypothetical protein
MRAPAPPRFAAVLLILLAAPAVLAAQETDPSRLYGRITTTDGSLYEGFIRWAGNEGGWFDILHGDKEIPDRNRRDAERLGWEPERRERRFEIFGIGITLPQDRVEVNRSAQSGIRFGHVSSLEVMGSSRARLLLKSGEEIELRGGSDVGSSVDEILVEDPRGGQVELDWGDVRTIDFLAGPVSPTQWGERLYGTLRTRDGERFTGYIAWDMDELFGEDVLDGEDRGHDREIPFARIRSIERYGSGAARVRLVDGEEVVLRGSNDVDDDNRDILVADPALGEVRVEWDAFDVLELERPPAVVAMDIFDGGARLRGTVEARGGETHTGWIRWDNDEEYTWEILDGELGDGVLLDVEMGRIQSIERVSWDASRVTLRDGRSFELTDSNDVDEGNKGVYVERQDGTMILVPWDRFERLVFDD